MSEKNSIIFSEGISGMISKYNDFIHSIAQSGYRNCIINPRIDSIVLDNPSYSVPAEGNLEKDKFCVLKWYAPTENGTNGAKLSAILEENIDRSYLEGSRELKLRLGVTNRELYNISELKIRQRKKYSLMATYQIVNAIGTPVEETDTTGRLVVTPYVKEGAYVPMATKMTLSYNENSLVDLSSFTYVKSFTYNSNDYVNFSPENVKIVLSGSKDSDEFFVKVHQIVFYEGSAELSGIVDKNHQFLDQLKLIDGIWRIGDIQIGNYLKNVVTVGNNSYSKYKDLHTAFSSEGSNKIFFITSNLSIPSTVTSGLAIPTKSTLIGNNYSLTINNSSGITLVNPFCRMENLTISCKKFSITGTNNVSLSNISLYLTGTETKGIYIFDSNNVNIESSKISGNISTLTGINVSKCYNIKINSVIEMVYLSAGISTCTKVENGCLSVDVEISFILVGSVMDNYVIFEVAGITTGNDFKLNKLYQDNGEIIEITDNIGMGNI